MNGDGQLGSCLLVWKTHKHPHYVDVTTAACLNYYQQTGISSRTTPTTRHRFQAHHNSIVTITQEGSIKICRKQKQKHLKHKNGFCRQPATLIIVKSNYQSEVWSSGSLCKAQNNSLEAEIFAYLQVMTNNRERQQFVPCIIHFRWFLITSTIAGNQ